MAELSRTAKFYRDNPKARKKRLKAQAAINRRPEERKRRSKLTMLNRKIGKPFDGLDVSHVGNKVVLKPQSANRGDNNDTKGDVRARGKKRVKSKKKSNGKG